MYPFKSTQYDTFMALVQASNPGLDIAPLTIDQLRTLVPTAITADSFGRDTSVRLMVKPGNSKYYGTQTVTYRRINPATYFRGMTITLDDYLTGSGNMSGAQFAVAMNAKYGTTFDPSGSDFSGTFSAVSGTQYNGVALQSTSLCYEGSISFKWTRGKQQIGTLVTNPVLAGRLYPGAGNSMPPTKPVGDFLMYNLDASSVKPQLNTLSGTYAPASFTSNTALQTVLGFMQRMRPDLNFSSADSGTAGGLGNLTWTRYTLPSAALPGGNSSKYASVMIVKAAAGSWFTGQIYLHYN